MATILDLEIQGFPFTLHKTAYIEQSGKSVVTMRK